MIKNLSLLPCLILFFGLTTTSLLNGQTTITATTANFDCMVPGTTQIEVPCGIEVDVTYEIWGGGGAGGYYHIDQTTRAATGGGGGGYSTGTMTLTAGVYDIVCGAGGEFTGPTDDVRRDGTNSSAFGITSGGGNGGSRGGNVGTGGAGATSAGGDGGVRVATGGGGGGGGSGPAPTVGGAGTATAGGAGGTPNGGDGGDPLANGMNATFPGGGGGGGKGAGTGLVSGNGADGQVLLTFINFDDQSVCYPTTSECASMQPGEVFDNNYLGSVCDIIANEEPTETLSVPAFDCDAAVAVTFDTPVPQTSVLYHYWGNCSDLSPAMPEGITAAHNGYIQQMFCGTDAYGLPAFPSGLSPDNGTINFLPQSSEDVGCMGFAATGNCDCGGIGDRPGEKDTELIQIDFWLAVPNIQTQIGFQLGGNRDDAASFFVGPDLSNMCEVAFHTDGSTHMALPDQLVGTYNIDADIHTEGCGLLWIRVRLYINDIADQFSVTPEINVGNGWVNVDQLFTIPADDVLDNTPPTAADITLTQTTGYYVDDMFFFDSDGVWSPYGCNHMVSATDPGLCAPACPTVNPVDDDNDAVCDGMLGTTISDWMDSVEADATNTAAIADANTALAIIYSLDATPTETAPPTAGTADATHAGTDCANETETTYAYLLCKGADAAVGGSDDSYLLLGTHTLTVYPPAQDPTDVIAACTNTPTVICMGDSFGAASNPNGGASAANWAMDIGVYTAQPGDLAGTIEVAITTTNGCTGTFEIATPACPGMCPAINPIDVPDDAVCDGMLGTTISDWMDSVEADAANTAAIADANTALAIIYSLDATPTETAPPTAGTADASHAGTGCTNETETTYAYLLCKGADAAVGGSDDSYLLLGTHTLTVYPPAQDPMDVIAACTNTPTVICMGDSFGAASNPTGGAGAANWAMGTGVYTAQPGDLAGTIEVAITTTNGCTGTFEIATPACPAAEVCEGDLKARPATFAPGTVAADGSSGTGGLTFADGSAATWNIANSSTPALQGFSSGLSTTGELYFYYDGPNDFDLTSTFDITGIPAGKVVKLRLYGSVQRPSGNNTFGAKFGDYTITWVGGTGNATVVDPGVVSFIDPATGMPYIDPATGMPYTVPSSSQIVGGGQTLTNGGSFQQTYDPASPTGAIPNGDLEWYVDFPAGATSFTITALAGRDKEGFRFSAVECECIDCDSFGDDGDALCTYLAECLAETGEASALATMDCDGGGIDNQTECDSGGDPFAAADDSCPDLTGIAIGDLDIGVTESTCTTIGGTPSGGSTTAPTTACPTGSTLMYSVDSGTTWSGTLPTYNQTTAITVLTRCECDLVPATVSATSTVTTDPGTCPECPDLTGIAIGDLDIGVTESTCTISGGTPSGGSTTAPTGTCPTGSTLMYSVDSGATWSGTLPTYNQTTAITVLTRCECDLLPATVSATSTVVTAPPACPCDAVTDVTCSNPTTTTLDVSWTAPAFAPNGYTVQASCDAGTTWATVQTATAEHPWINEIHYENDGPEAANGVEIAGPAGLSLDCYSVHKYDGGDNEEFGTPRVLSGSIDDENNTGFGALWFNYNLQNDLEAIALVYNGDGSCDCPGAEQLIQFISYEGTMTALDGPAAGVMSTSIGVNESSTTTLATESLQLSGCGDAYADFTWNAPSQETKGDLNTGQQVYLVESAMATAINLDPCTEYSFRVLSNCCGLESAWVETTASCTTSALTIVAVDADPTICDGEGIGSTLTDWQANVNDIDMCLVTDIIFSTIASGAAGFPGTDLAGIDGIHSGADNCATETQTVFAYQVCDPDKTAGSGDESYQIAGTYTLMVYPAAQEPTDNIFGCTNTPTLICTDDSFGAASNPMGGANVANWVGGAYTAQPGDLAGTIDIAITTTNGCTGTFEINTPACPGMCPVVNPIFGTDAVCDGMLGTTISDWVTNVEANAANMAAVANANTGAAIIYSVDVAPTEVAPPSAVTADASHSGTGCANETESTYAYLLCMGIDGAVGGGDDIYMLLGIHTLTVYPPAQTPTDNITGCTNTPTLNCTDDVYGAASNPTGGASAANWDSATGVYTALVGNAAGTIDIAIATANGCTGTFTIATPVCASCDDAGLTGQDICDSLDALGAASPFSGMDCDGDGETNEEECDSGTDPTDPCDNSYADGAEVCAAIAAGATGFADVDCDGGGVNDEQECTDGTDPTDPCDDAGLTGAIICASIDALGAASPFYGFDCDEDGETNEEECGNGTDPLDPCDNSYADGAEVCAAIAAGATGFANVDCDGGGVNDEQECTDGTDPTDPCDDAGLTGAIICASIDALGTDSPFHSFDCDDDGETNEEECGNGTDPLDPCDNSYADGAEVCAAIAAGATGFANVDCDGGGVNDEQECDDGTDPTDPCDDVGLTGAIICASLDALGTDSPFSGIDCDNDGQTNEEECGNGTDPLDPCDNSYADGAAICAAIDAGATGFADVDCDGGGVSDEQECANGTDPTDPCDDNPPAAPATECWETATYNNATCIWEITGTQPAEPTNIQCWETTTFNNTSCAWEITGAQPAEPPTQCFETATYNTTICAWVITGTQPTEPTTQCYETTTFNTSTCVWDVTGTQPAEPTIECYEVANFNTTTCDWEVSGSETTAPTTQCWETATFNAIICNWAITGTQPAEPATECWETATFNNITCAWVVTGTQPADPGCDDGDCTNGMETWDGCNCIAGLAPVTGCTNPMADNYNPLATCDDGTCVTSAENCPDPGNCDDGDCTNGIESWDDILCECVSGFPPVDPGNCDDGNCRNGIETWDGCDCVAGTPPSDCEGIELIHFDFDDCRSLITDMSGTDYSEFQPEYSNNLTCGSVVATNIYRNEPTINSHSCTPGLGNSASMCISSLNSCDADFSSTKAVKFSITISPVPGESIKLSSVEFMQKAPLNFDWINGVSGLNNYPTRYGIQILENGTEIYLQEDLSTSTDWTNEVHAFNGVFTEQTTIDILLLSYCPIGIQSNVTAWDLEDLKIFGDCSQTVGSRRMMAGKVTLLNNEQLDDVMVTVEGGDSMKSDNTDTSGAYAFADNSIGQNYLISAYKDSDYLKGISTLDLVLIQRHILGISKFDDPLLYHAADVNNDNRINGIDLVELRKLILGINKEFSQNLSYRFFDKSKVENELNPWSIPEEILVINLETDEYALDFSPIKIGDVTSLLAQTKTLMNRSSDADSIIKLYSDKTDSNYSDIVNTDFYITDQISINGFQLAIDLNGSEFDKLITADQIVNDIDYHLSDDNILRILWTGDINFEGNKNLLFSIQTIGSDYDHNFSDAMSSEIYVDNSPIKLELINNNNSSAISSITNLRVYPNPFRDKTEVEFDLVNDTKVDIYLYDARGKIVYQENRSFTKGKNTIPLKEALFTSGIYFIKVSTDKESLTKRLVKLK